MTKPTLHESVKSMTDNELSEEFGRLEQNPSDNQEWHDIVENEMVDRVLRQRACGSCGRLKSYHFEGDGCQ